MCAKNDKNNKQASHIKSYIYRNTHLVEDQ